MKTIEWILFGALVALAFGCGNAFGTAGEHERICRHYPQVCEELGDKP